MSHAPAVKPEHFYYRLPVGTEGQTDSRHRSKPESNPHIRQAASGLSPHFLLKSFSKSSYLLNGSSSILPRFTYPKSEHLKSRKAIEQLFKSGESFFVYPYKVVYRFESPEVGTSENLKQETGATSDHNSEIGDKTTTEQPSSGLSDFPTSPLLSGFAAPSKNFRRAVDRNRIKRLGREAFRLNKHPLERQLADNQLALQMFFIFADKKLPDWKLIEPKMQACLKKLIHLTKKHHEKLLQG